MGNEAHTTFCTLVFSAINLLPAYAVRRKKNEAVGTSHGKITQRHNTKYYKVTTNHTFSILILRIGILFSPLNRTHGRVPFALCLFSDSERNEEDDVYAPPAAQGRESQDARLDRSGITPRGEQLAGAAAVTRGIVAR